MGLVAGGALAASVSGQTLPDIISIADWYATLCEAAGGADCTADPEAAAAGLPPIDSVSHWGLLSGTVPPGVSHRSVLHASNAAVINGSWKLVVGKQPYSGWTGPKYPNNTGSQPPPGHGWVHDCHAGCLYNVVDDPTEHADLAGTEPDRLAAMQQQLDELNKANFNPDRGRGDPRACTQAVANGGFYGPFVGL